MLKHAAPIEQRMDSYMSDLILLGEVPQSGFERVGAF